MYFDLTSSDLSPNLSLRNSYVPKSGAERGGIESEVMRARYLNYTLLRVHPIVVVLRMSVEV